MGKIFDESTENPLNFVNVFLANTTLGDVSDESGNYIITNVPPGFYKLVATMMGYTVQRKMIKVYNQMSIIIDFNLKPIILQGENVTVTAKYPKEWKKNLKIFERIFFGKKEFAKKCKLINPEVLDLKYDRKSGHFKAISEGTLTFINNALGYEVTLFLEEFYAELFTNDDIYIIEGNQEGMPSNIKRGIKRYKTINFFKQLIPKNKK